MIKLDYKLEAPEERVELVNEILSTANEDDLNEKYLEILADYLILCMEKQEKKERKILTDNRLATVNKRECSFEGLVSQLENGEDGIYNLISENKQKCRMYSPLRKMTPPALKSYCGCAKVWSWQFQCAGARTLVII